MTQFQFDAICKIIEAGAPALANELCGALQGLVQTCNAALDENAKLKADKDSEKDSAEPKAE
jgi:hypothetical protein